MEVTHVLNGDLEHYLQKRDVSNKDRNNSTKILVRADGVFGFVKVIMATSVGVKGTVVSFMVERDERFGISGVMP